MRVSFKNTYTQEVSTECWVSVDELDSTFARDISDIAEAVVQVAPNLEYKITDDDGNIVEVG